MRVYRIASAIAAGMLLLGLSACSSHKSATASATTTTAEQQHSITGSVTLIGSEDTFSGNGEYTVDNGACSGTNGYDDLTEGLQVTVTNETGTLIGTGNLDAGQVTDAGCSFAFVVHNLPVAKFYRIEAGHRGQVSYSYDRMQAAGWSAELSIG
jgi:hypothetical protein